MKKPDVIYVEFSEDVNLAFEKQPFEETPAYIRKDMVVDAIELAYGKVSMDPFDYFNAFRELLKKVGYEIH